MKKTFKLIVSILLILGILFFLFALISPFAYRAVRCGISRTYPDYVEIQNLISQKRQKFMESKDPSICNELPETMKHWTGDCDDAPLPIQARAKCLEGY